MFFSTSHRSPRLVGRLGNSGLVAHRTCPAERALDRGGRGGVALLRQQRREQPIARGIADADVLRRTGQVLHQAGGLAGGDAQRVPGLRRVQAKQLRAGRRGAEHAAGRGDVPAPRVMAGRDDVADPALDLGAQDERVQQRRTRQPALFRQRQVRPARPARWDG